MGTTAPRTVTLEYHLQITEVLADALWRQRTEYHDQLARADHLLSLFKKRDQECGELRRKLHELQELILDDVVSVVEEPVQNQPVTQSKP